MKNIDYKQLRSYSNLPKYDPGMEPISSGYLRGDNFIQTGAINNPTQDIQNPYKSYGIAEISGNMIPLMKLGESLKDVYSASKAALSLAATNTNAASMPASIASLPEQPVTSLTITSAAAAKESAANAASKASAASSAAIPIAALTTLYGGYKSIEAADQYGRSPVSASELLSTTGSYTESANNVGYTRLSGVANTDKLLNDYNNAGMASSVSGGLTFGAGAGTLIGSLIPGGLVIGGILGAGLGALGGAITGWINRGKAKRKMQEILQNVNNAIAGYNDQNEAEAASQGIRNQYYATHADCGKTIKADLGLGLMSGGETKVETATINGKTRVTDATTIPITANTPYRVDNVLFNAKDSTGIVGNKKNPKTGLPYVVQGNIYALMFNSGDPYLRAVGEKGLLATLSDLGKTPNNNPNPYDALMADKGKNMKIKKYWGGKPLDRYTGWDALKQSNTLNLVTNAIQALGGMKQLITDKHRDVYVPSAEVEDGQSMGLLNQLPVTVNTRPAEEDLLNDTRHALYRIKQNGSMTSGLKLLYNLATLLSLMKSRNDLFAKKIDTENQLMTNKVSIGLPILLLQVARTQLARQERINNFLKAGGAKYNAVYKDLMNIFTPLATFAQNANNNAWALADINQWEQDNRNKNITEMLKTGLTMDQIKAYGLA